MAILQFLNLARPLDRDASPLHLHALEHHFEIVPEWIIPKNSNRHRLLVLCFRPLHKFGHISQHRRLELMFRRLPQRIRNAHQNAEHEQQQPSTGARHGPLNDFAEYAALFSH
jgi:hypothetical protein